ncbi:interleukin-1 receptor-associated kinase 1-binding protein 1 homolog [Bombina bombina]|uniref:interleukin-1 receptor-associated kinase 1-binding protein 1 n=1 Tax=Bombina bombina TaxID=8345 RepID=UPI00235B2DA2|nr:interleukin-1 receptor-associated kinase 1-binding protein 1 [Bombina bombina]XP_053565056.1 interleukin-1 receptor-associated kinase 1-binding protein 1 homolog [Bombina bombina]
MATVQPASRLFASLQLPDSCDQTLEERENKPGLLIGQRARREVHVTGTAELSADPDRASVCMRLVSNKESAAEVKSSVQRRLEYILQSLRHSGITEENITVSKEFQKISNAYQMEAEVCVIFSDFQKLQNICNLLVEKLESSVSICSPKFYHTPESMEKLRREVCLAAVSNARRKALEVCRLVGQSLGRALVIREEELRELQDQGDSYSALSTSIQQRIKSGTIYATSKVFATFEIMGKEKNKKKCQGI